MTDRPRHTQAPRHARLFELIRQGLLAEQAMETRPLVENAGRAHRPFMETAQRSLIG